MATRPDGTYWRRNALDAEVERLRLLERIADGRTIRLLEDTGITAGWRCAELGAGAGSIARWMADRIAPDGSLVVVDLDTSAIADLRDRTNVEVEEADLTEFALPRISFDLVHTRNLLMHLPERDRVLAELAASLRPGGILVVEEADGFPAEAATDERFRRTVLPLTRRWTWARTLPALVQGLGLTGLRVLVETELLQGGTDLAAFWHHTLASARPLLLESAPDLAPADLAASLALLEDRTFWSPFMAVVCVTAAQHLR